MFWLTGVLRHSTVCLLSWVFVMQAWHATLVQRSVRAGDDFEQAPINYGQSAGDNRVEDLIRRLAAGEHSLARDPQFGHLRSLLDALEVPPSSQMLVFSKTSFQRQRIAPETPRAIYFSDDTYVGYCQGGEVLELSAVDRQLGAIFYTVSQAADTPARIQRLDNECLLCHGSSQTQGVPGHLVRSVYSDDRGFPILSFGTHQIDHSSPLAERWGGWYVTGQHGTQTHLGNLLFQEKREPEQTDRTPGMNVTNLADRFDTSAYLAPHSDLVALMVLEHQTAAHNLLTRAAFSTRIALYQESEYKRELGETGTDLWEGTERRIQAVGEPLVRYLLFSGEAPLTAPLLGTSSFTQEFAARGPRDPQGRSLRDFDLQRRLFKYPCSYLIYSQNFADLPPTVRNYVERRLWEVLTGQDSRKEFVHLSPADRQAILEILRATKSDLPDYWHAAPQTAAISATARPGS